LPTVDLVLDIVRRVASKSVTSWQLSRLRGSDAETCLMDSGHYRERRDCLPIGDDVIISGAPRKLQNVD